MEIIRRLWEKFSWVERCIIAAIALVLLVTAYAMYREVDSWSLHEGTVISKDYFPPRVDVQMVPSGNTSVPVQHYYPERYTVTFKGVDDKGKEKTRTVDVPPVRYETLRIGDHYKVPDD